MNDEPFGPLAPISPFKDFDGVMQEANRLPWGLAAYAYTKNSKTSRRSARPSKAAWCRSTTMASPCRKCRSAA